MQTPPIASDSLETYTSGIHKRFEEYFKQHNRWPTGERRAKNAKKFTNSSSQCGYENWLVAVDAEVRKRSDRPRHEARFAQTEGMDLAEVREIGKKVEFALKTVVQSNKARNETEASFYHPGQSDTEKGLRALHLLIDKQLTKIETDFEARHDVMRRSYLDKFQRLSQNVRFWYEQLFRNKTHSREQYRNVLVDHFSKYLAKKDELIKRLVKELNANGIDSKQSEIALQTTDTEEVWKKLKAGEWDDSDEEEVEFDDNREYMRRTKSAKGWNRRIRSRSLKEKPNKSDGDEVDDEDEATERLERRLRRRK